MAQNDTLIIRAALEGKTSVYRDIEIEGSKSLYRLAEAIVSAFGFDFDHAFGFYSGLRYATMMRGSPKYELFVDMGDADPGVLSVKKTKVAQAFPAVGHAMLFLFDYGDEWLFRVRLEKTAKKIAKVRYPRIVPGSRRFRRGRADLRGQSGDRRKTKNRQAWGLRGYPGAHFRSPKSTECSP